MNQARCRLLACYLSPVALFALVGAGCTTSNTGARPAIWCLESQVRALYPSVAQKRGVEGVVTVRIEVGEDGAARSVSVAESSGDESLDRAALTAARNARFVKQGGGKAPAATTLKFRFELL